MPTQVETRRVNPALALFIELDSLNVSLLRVLDALEKTRPQGKIFPITRTITATTIREDVVPAWFSFHLVNDGPDDLEFSINEPSVPFSSLPSGESLDVDMVVASIERIFFRSSGTASFRAYGVY